MSLGISKSLGSSSSVLIMMTAPSKSSFSEPSEPEGPRGAGGPRGQEGQGGRRAKRDQLNMGPGVS